MKTLDLFRHDFVLSIRPEYAAKIIVGRKTVELRRRFPTITVTGAVAYIYATAPVQAIIGWATIADVKTLPVSKIWKDYHSVACIDLQDFEEYFGDLENGCVIELEQPRSLDQPVSLATLKEVVGFVPPQSYCYAEELLQKLVRHA